MAGSKQDRSVTPPARGGQIARRVVALILLFFLVVGIVTFASWMVEIFVQPRSWPVAHRTVLTRRFWLW